MYVSKAPFQLLKALFHSLKIDSPKNALNKGTQSTHTYTHTHPYMISHRCQFSQMMLLNAWVTSYINVYSLDFCISSLKAIFRI